MSLTIALDMMSGDVGPRVTVPALFKVLSQYSMPHFLLFGDKQQLQPLLSSLPTQQLARLQIIHTDKLLDSDPLYALRHNKGSTVRLMLDAVKQGVAASCVSAVNSVTLLGLTKMLLPENCQKNGLSTLNILPNFTGGSTALLALEQINSGEGLLAHIRYAVKVAEERLELVYPKVALLDIKDGKGYSAAIHRLDAVLHKESSVNYVGKIALQHYLADSNIDLIITDIEHSALIVDVQAMFSRNILQLMQTNETKLLSVVSQVRQKVSQFTELKPTSPINKINLNALLKRHQCQMLSVLCSNVDIINLSPSAQEQDFVDAIEQIINNKKK